MRSIRLATRASPLAMWQARHVARKLRRVWPRLRVELVAITSSGDQDVDTPLYGMGNVGVFAREVHHAVLDGRADAAVHSCKDLPTTVPDGCAPPVILARHDPRDALIGAASIAGLPQGAVVGSSSLRRRHQLAAIRPDLHFVNIRGNIQTRMGKVTSGEVDATLLACAGLARMGLMRTYAARGLDPWHELVPAPAQGAIAIDHRAQDHRIARLLAPLNDADTAVAVAIERRVLAGLRGGCSLPLGCYARRRGSIWELRTRLSPEGQTPVESERSGPASSIAQQALTDLGVTAGGVL